MWICQKIYTLKLLRDAYVSLFTMVFVCILVFLPKSCEIVVAVDKEEALERHVVVIIVPDFSFEELEFILENSSYPHLWSGGYYGAINLRSEGNYSYLNNMVSISVGKRALGVSNWNGYNISESLDGYPVDNLYLQWHGRIPTGSIVHPHVNMLRKKNLDTSFQGEVGWLGNSLEQQGVHTYALGNADTREEKIRYVSLIIMNRQGEADGHLHGGITEDKFSPMGMKMNHKALVEEIHQVQVDHSQTFTVVEWGDLHRLFKEEPNMTTEHFERMYGETLQRLESSLDRLLADVDGELWLVSPAVNPRAYKNKNQLGPIWVWKDTGEKGWLYSNTTRRFGLISNTDLAITWDEIFSTSKDKRKLTTGQPIEFIHNGVNSTQDWSIKNFLHRIKEINYVFDKRGAVLSSYVSSLVFMLIVVSFMIWRLKNSRRWKKLAEILLLSGILSPVFFLITSPWTFAISAFLYVLVIFLGSLLVGAAIRRIFTHSFSIVCLLFFLVLTVDIITGSYLIQRSFLSYDPVIGARYYGIGNEFAGIYLVTGLLMIAPLLKNGRKPLLNWSIVLMVIVVMVLILGSSSLGANAGASLSASVVLIYASLQLLLKKASWRKKLLIAIGIPVVMLGLLYVLQMAQPSSHIFIAFEKLLAGDLVTIWQTIIRKLEMNWKIFRISYWTQLFVTSYFFIGIVLWRRKRSQLETEQLFLMNSSIVASIALLLLNDSGIVAAATSMFITLCVCYGWSIEDGEKESKKS